MTTYQPEERPYTGYSYRPPGSAHGEMSSPERLHSSQGYMKNPPPPQSPYQSHDQPPPGSSHGYPPQPPITPLSGSNYPPQPPPSSGGYYGLSTPGDPNPVPSPPPSSSGRPTSQHFTPDGVPIVPVGISGGKMFRCRGYGECDKVFTRSEHLARHVRKHTGERPFPCHCGKAFSRLDNLRQHAATVHADQATLNEAMLNSLAPVHAALSQRANRDQRKRGEVVEVPKNAVERPRHNEQYRGQKGPPPPGGSVGGSPYAPYSQGEFGVPPPHARPRTGGGYDYQYPPPMDGQPPHVSPGDESRRPASSSYQSYPPPVYYDQQQARPPTAPGAAGPDAMSQLPYPYRPMSSNGRELPVPAHYSESEPPSSAHGPPQSPMYPPGVAPPQWSSPPPPPHSGYQHHQQGYPPAEAFAYPPPPPPEHSQGYGPPPSGSAHSQYSYPPPAPGYYPPQAYGALPPPQGGQYPPPQAYAPPPPPGPPESPFQYHAPPSQEGYSYGGTPYDTRKRRADDSPEDATRKQPRQTPLQAPPQHLHDAMAQPRPQESLWLPPTSERRSSLAISALLGSPQQAPRSRPATADLSHQSSSAGQATYGPPGSAGFTYTPQESSSGSISMPATPIVNGTPRKPPGTGEIKLEGGGGVGENMEQKAKALLSQGR